MKHFADVLTDFFVGEELPLVLMSETRLDLLAERKVPEGRPNLAHRGSGG